MFIVWILVGSIDGVFMCNDFMGVDVLRFFSVCLFVLNFLKCLMFNFWCKIERIVVEFKFYGLCVNILSVMLVMLFDFCFVSNEFMVSL